MIPKAFIDDWRAQAPWPMPSQVEQDLLLSRALVQLYAEPAIRRRLAFRGGTALYKLHLRPAPRYSEDLDFVQVTAEPVGETLDAIRDILDPWLGQPRRTLKDGSIVLLYRVWSEDSPPVALRLKLEINPREHYAVYGTHEVPFALDSPWFRGSSLVCTYRLEELLGTKLRALYQRRKGRDLFDLHFAATTAKVSGAKVVECFLRYTGQEGNRVSRAEFERNLDAKLDDPRFLSDIAPLLAPGTPWDPAHAVAYIRGDLVPRLPGAPWRGVGRR